MSSTGSDVSVYRNRVLLDQLSDLIAKVSGSEPADLQAIADIAREIRDAIAPTGVVYATRAQAGVQRQIATLLNQTSQHLREYHHTKDAGHLGELLRKMRAACSLADSYDETADAQMLQTPEGELLGTILIVGWW
jgi:hypothetical protein